MTSTKRTPAGKGQVDSRVSELAASVDCMSDEEFAVLANVKLSTLDAWRRRGKGPDYILLGNRYIYPRSAVRHYLQTLVRSRGRLGVATAL